MNANAHQQDRMAWHPDWVRLALSSFRLDPRAEHGVSHWARVKYHGVRLARIYGVNPCVPTLFSLFHDCCRENEYDDPAHGERAARQVENWMRRGRLPDLSSHDRHALIQACAEHSDGLTQAPRLVQVCWDADRLDLGRVGIRPDPRFLCTEAAQEIALRTHAYQWSRGRPWRLPATSRERAFGR